MDKETALSDIKYYWSSYGDIERLSDWQDALRLFPDIERAWRDYRYARTVLGLVIKNAPE